MTVTMTVQLSAYTYTLLAQRAKQIASSPDVLADEVLRRELQPTHPYITMEQSPWGKRAVVKESGTPVSVIVGYSQQGLAPEAFAEEVHPALTPAHVHDALSYYYDHHDEVDHEIAEATEAAARQQLRERMNSTEDYLRITGQRR